MKIVVENPAGWPDRIAADLERAEFKHADECAIAHVQSEEQGTDWVIIEASNSNAAKALYDWLEETKRHYKREYIDAKMEYQAAAELADAVYEEKIGLMKWICGLAEA